MKYCIFVERAFDENCFDALKEFCYKQLNGNLWQFVGASVPRIFPENVKLFCITPVNYPLAVAEQGYKGTKKQFSRILAKRYHELENMGCEINLHLHLGLRLENIDQKKMFKEAMEWMHDNGFKPKLWTAGWYSYDKESISIGRKHGMEFFNDRFHFSFHDYQYDGIYTFMMIITNIRGILR